MPFFQAESYATLVDDENETVAKIFFDPGDYRVLENCGFAELKVCKTRSHLHFLGEYF